MIVLYIHTGVIYQVPLYMNFYYDFSIKHFRQLLNNSNQFYIFYVSTLFEVSLQELIVNGMYMSMYTHVISNFDIQFLHLNLQNCNHPMTFRRLGFFKNIFQDLSLPKLFNQNIVSQQGNIVFFTFM